METANWVHCACAGVILYKWRNGSMASAIALTVVLIGVYGVLSQGMA